MERASMLSWTMQTGIQNMNRAMAVESGGKPLARDIRVIDFSLFSCLQDTTTERTPTIPQPPTVLSNSRFRLDDFIFFQSRTSDVST